MPLGDSLSDFIEVGKKSSPINFRPSRRSAGSGWALTVIMVFTIGIFLFLLAGLIRLQIFQGSYFRALASANRSRVDVIHAPRGAVFDRNGVLMAGSQGAFRLQECDKKSVCHPREISREEALKLEAKDLPKTSRLEIDSERYYPFGPAMSQVMGYLSEVSAQELSADSSYFPGDKVGRSGIEAQYEKILRGQDGREIVEVDALGRKIRSLGIEPAKNGHDINLTIDASLSKVAFEALEGRKGAAVVSSPQTGEIISLISSPSFDNNFFTSLSLPVGERNSRVEAILSDPNLSMFNRAISAAYPPGSTFKIVGAIAGLETGKITVNTTIDDPGILVIGPYKFPNWKYLRDGGTQGTLNVVGALQKSNDIFFYKVGEWVGEESLFNWAKKLGLSRPLGIDLPGEAGGLIPDKSWRDANSRGWYLGDTYHAAIGQGDVLVTPLQNNWWTGIVANGGKFCWPHLLSNLSDLRNLCKDLGIKKSTIDLVKQGMIAACSPGGTAYPLFDFKVRKLGKNGQEENVPVQIACKTGTAEFGQGVEQTHAWLTAFAPAEKPEIAVTVVVENFGEGSDVAAPVVKKIMEEWFGR